MSVAGTHRMHNEAGYDASLHSAVFRELLLKFTPQQVCLQRSLLGKLKALDTKPFFSESHARILTNITSSFPSEMRSTIDDALCMTTTKVRLPAFCKEGDVITIKIQNSQSYGRTTRSSQVSHVLTLSVSDFQTRTDRTAKYAYLVVAHSLRGHDDLHKSSTLYVNGVEKETIARIIRVSERAIDKIRNDRESLDADEIGSIMSTCNKHGLEEAAECLAQSLLAQLRDMESDMRCTNVRFLASLANFLQSVRQDMAWMKSSRGVHARNEMDAVMERVTHKINTKRRHNEAIAEAIRQTPFASAFLRNGKTIWDVEHTPDVKIDENTDAYPYPNHVMRQTGEYVGHKFKDIRHWVKASKRYRNQVDGLVNDLKVMLKKRKLEQNVPPDNRSQRERR